MVAAAGGLPAEVTANWRTKDIGTVDVEFGFSCMGYEIAGGWGGRIINTPIPFIWAFFGCYMYGARVGPNNQLPYMHREEPSLHSFVTVLGLPKPHFLRQIYIHTCII